MISNLIGKSFKPKWIRFLAVVSGNSPYWLIQSFWIEGNQPSV